MRSRTNGMLGPLLVVSVLLGGCPPKAPEPRPDPPPQPGSDVMARADIQARSGSSLSGTATFSKKDNKVVARIEVRNAAPGLHGVHVHEKGDCSDAQAMNAGGHFNPLGAPHGGPGEAAHHPGDFGNIKVGSDGTGALDIETDALTLGEGTMSIAGKSIVIHEKEDDLTTQPSGNSGARIGCGVITATGAAPR